MSARRAVVMGTLAAMCVAPSLRAGDVTAPPRELLLPPPAPSREAAPPTLRLQWIDVDGATHGVDDLARSEASGILERTGLDASWRLGSAGELAWPREVRVILLARSVFEGSSSQPVLGSTPSGPRSHPHVWIHVGSVRWAIGLRPEPPAIELPSRARRDLAVALGRVVAHEVVHAVVPSLEHAADLMSETLTRRELTASRIAFDPAAALAVRAAVLGLSDAPASEPGVLATTGEIGTPPAPARVSVRGGAGVHPGRARDR